MIRLIIFFILVEIFSINSYAATLKVLSLKGNATYLGKEVIEGEEFTASGIFETIGKAYAKLYIKNWDTTIVIGSNSKMEFDLTKMKTNGNYTLENGICRWVSDAKKHLEMGPHVDLVTKAAAFGVRGTDFFASANEDFEEAEIIVFSGQVNFSNQKNKKDSKLINPGQWGGVGGRYGKKIGPLLNLSKEQQKKFQDLLAL